MKSGTGERTGIIPARAGFTQEFPHTLRYMGDHPRSRGVYPPDAMILRLAVGSSPLARGLPSRPAGGSARRGIIPARAGFTDSRRSDMRGGRDHPRSRGVYAGVRAAMVPRMGSSPLARGLRNERQNGGERIRIIPARAGFTPADGASQEPCPDHPRSRGVYLMTLTPDQSATGSSPLARGLRDRVPRRPPQRGIIPARAGFTTSRSPMRWSARDHPRSRGVYASLTFFNASWYGSSPLARGLHPLDLRFRPVGGIIPARAGFTSRCGTAKQCQADHPRSRGVYLQQVVGDDKEIGSSPLARGLLTTAKGSIAEGRIIPARAGFTLKCWMTLTTTTDHPRSRGVYRYKPELKGCKTGSSPLARGLRLKVWIHDYYNGIIPARAGFTDCPADGDSFRWDHPRSRGVYEWLGPMRALLRGSSPLARGLLR